MKGLSGVFVALVSLGIAAILQRGLSPHLSFGGVAPDFLLLVIATLGLFSNRSSGALLGFGAGLLQGGLSGANMAVYVVSRTVCGYLLGWFNLLELESNPIVATIATVCVTMGCQLFIMFWAPPPGISAFMGSTAGSALMNACLAAPVYLLLRQFLVTRRL